MSSLTDQSSAATVLTHMTAPNGLSLGGDRHTEETVVRPVGRALLVSMLVHTILLALTVILATRVIREHATTTPVAQSTASMTPGRMVKP